MVSLQPLLLTLQLIAVAVLVAAVLGVAAAWAIWTLGRESRWERSLAAGAVIAALLAIVTPLVLHAAAWEATAGKFGWMFLTQTGARGGQGGAYGFFRGLVAAGWIHGLVGTALVTLTTWHGVRRTPATLLDQSLLMLSPQATWWRVRLPIAMPWCVLGLLATGLLAATEMTVVDLYGYRTLADEFYLFYIVDPSPLAVLLTAGLPLILVAPAIGWWLLVRRRRFAIQGATAAEIHRDEAVCERSTLPQRSVAAFLALMISAAVVAIPMLGLVIKLGHEVVVVGNDVIASWSAREAVTRLISAPRYFAEEYQWTAVIAVAAGLIAAVVASPLAAYARTRPSVERWLDVVTIAAVVIPGPLVGVALVRFFQLGIPGFRALYAQTLVPTLLAVSVRAIPVAYWIMRAAYRNIGSEVLDAARMDASWSRRLWQVHRPLVQRYVAVAATAAGVVASGDVPATLPVLPPGVSTVGTRLFGLLHSGARHQEASLAIWYLASLMLISLIFIRQTGRRTVD